MFLGEGVPKKWHKFTGEHSCCSAISIKLQNNFVEIKLWHGCSPVNLLHILGTPFPKNTIRGLLLDNFVEVAFGFTAELSNSSLWTPVEIEPTAFTKAILFIHLLKFIFC